MIDNYSYRIKTGDLLKYKDFMSHPNASKIEEILKDEESGKIEPSAASVSNDARKWLASKMYPKVFSDKIHLQHDMTVDVRKQHIEELRKMTKR